MIRFFFGEDTFRLNEKINEIKEDFFKKTPNANLGVFDCLEKNCLDDLFLAIRSQGLFSEDKLIICKNIIFLKSDLEKEKLYDFLEKYLLGLDEKNLNLIFIQEGKVQKNDRILKWFLKNINNIEFSNLDEKEIKKWVSKRLDVFGFGGDNYLIEKIIESGGNDLNLINNEILKIVNYFGNRGEYLKEDLEKLMSSRVEADIFKTIEHISSGNKKMAIETLHNQIEKGDDPFYILSMYIYQWRTLLKIGDFYYKGITNNFEIAKLCSLSPFVVQKNINQLRNFNLEKLKEAYKKLEEIDIDSKRGKTDVVLGLEIFIAGIK